MPSKSSIESLAIFPSVQGTLKGIHALRERKVKNFVVYSPVPHHDIEHALHREKSPVRIFTLVGGLLGFCTGWALTIYSVYSYPLIVGGKPLISIPPFGVLAYILTILFGALATLIGFLINARLPQVSLAATYDGRLSSDHYGIRSTGTAEEMKEFEVLMKKSGAVSFRRAEAS